jgi:hypothetical protein
MAALEPSRRFGHVTAFATHGAIPTSSTANRVMAGVPLLSSASMSLFVFPYDLMRHAPSTMLSLELVDILLPSQNPLFAQSRAS